MRAGPPALCAGRVGHRRLSPTGHAFEQAVTFVWLDPDDPNELCRHHRLWSHDRAAPVRFRRADYGDGTDRPLGAQVRDDLALVFGRAPTGPVRMLTQLRRWGWLFNPITVYVAWDDDPERPVGAVLEVTNTPWKERHRYVTALQPEGDGPVSDRFSARLAKVLHVSPFLDEDFDYLFELAAPSGDRGQLRVGLDVVRPGTTTAVLTTSLTVERRPADRRSLGHSLWHDLAPTHRVSAGIHLHGAILAAKQVPIVAHPKKRASCRDQ